MGLFCRVLFSRSYSTSLFCRGLFRPVLFHRQSRVILDAIDKMKKNASLQKKFIYLTNFYELKVQCKCFLNYLRGPNLTNLLLFNSIHPRSIWNKKQNEFYNDNSSHWDRGEQIFSLLSSDKISNWATSVCFFKPERK